MKRFAYLFAFGLLALGLAACSYQIEPPPSQPAAPLTAYASKVPGKWALLVDAGKASAAPQAAGLRCSRSDYALDFSKFLSETAEATFKTVADDIRITDHPLSAAELASGGYSGVIALRVTDLRAKAAVETAVVADADATTEIDAEILVLKDGARLVDVSETGAGSAHHDAGLACGGVADAASQASEEAVQDVVRKLAEQFANSHSVRYSPSGLTPQ